MTTTFGDMEPVAGINDIITVDGYGIRTFRVNSFSFEHYVDAEFEFSEIWYDIVCIDTGEELLASNEEVTVVLRAEESIGYKPPEIKEKEPAGPGIDELLDELRDALELVEIFGEHEDEEKEDRKYALKVAEVKAKLKEASA